MVAVNQSHHMSYLVCCGITTVVFPPPSTHVPRLWHATTPSFVNVNGVEFFSRRGYHNLRCDIPLSELPGPLLFNALFELLLSFRRRSVPRELNWQRDCNIAVDYVYLSE